MDERIRKSLSSFNAVEELTVSVSQITSSFALLQSWRSRYYTNFWVAIPLLCHGIEKLQKMLLHMVSMNADGSFGEGGEVRGFNHNVVAINDAIVKRLEQTVPELPRATGAVEFLRSDPLFHLILKFAQDYLKEDRYYHLDGVPKSSNPAEGPKSEWANIVETAAGKIDFADIVSDDGYRRYRDLAIRRIIACLERAIHSYAVAITDSSALQPAKQYMGPISHFRDLDAGSFGLERYQVLSW